LRAPEPRMTSLGLGWLSAANTCPSVRSPSTKNAALELGHTPTGFPAPRHRDSSARTWSSTRGGEEGARVRGRARTDEIEATANAHCGDGSHQGPPERGLTAVVEERER
jgi:hypothetical protein